MEDRTKVKSDLNFQYNCKRSLVDEIHEARNNLLPLIDSGVSKSSFTEFHLIRESFRTLSLDMNELGNRMSLEMNDFKARLANIQEQAFDDAMDKIQGMLQLPEPSQKNSKRPENTSHNKSATATGTISTISPTIPFNAPETTSFMNEIFIYEEQEEEEFTLTPNDENFLSTEDHKFVDSISSSTFSGIFLPSLFYDFSKYLKSPEPTLSNVDDSDSASSDLTIVVQKSFSCQPFSDVLESLLVAEYDVISRILVFVIDEYVIFVWDPGKFYFL